MQKNVFTLEEVNKDDKLFGSSTTLLSKHIYKKFISVYQLIFSICQISINIQALGHNPVPHPSPNGEDCANSNNSNILLML